MSDKRKLSPKLARFYKKVTVDPDQPVPGRDVTYTTTETEIDRKRYFSTISKEIYARVVVGRCPDCDDDLTVSLDDIETEGDYFCGDFVGTSTGVDGECGGCGLEFEIALANYRR